MLVYLLMVMVIFLLSFVCLLLTLKFMREKASTQQRTADIDEWDIPEVNTEREKKEFIKNAIEHWREENKNTRVHFTKKRKTRKDKGKRRYRGPSEKASDSAGTKRGKPKGSNGDTWKRPPEEHIDKVIHVHLEKCPNCGAASDQLGPAGGIWEHTISDLVLGKHNRQLVVTKYIIHRYRCKKCKKIVTMDFGILKDCHFGFGFIATVMQSRIESKHSYSKILIELARWIPFLDRLVSPTTIVDWFKKYGAHLEEFYLACVEKLKDAKYVHADETGLPMNGKNWWLWVITTTVFTLFIPHASRGHEAIEEFFDKFEGVLISDFWGAYNNLTEGQQKCLAHLVKDLKKMIMEGEVSIKKITKRLKDDDKLKNKRKKGSKETQSRGRGRPKKQPDPLSAAERKELQEKKRGEAKKIVHGRVLYGFFKRAWEDEDDPLSYKARPEIRATEEEAVGQLKSLIEKIEADGDVSPDIRRLIKRFRRYEPFLFTYLKHPGIPPDNNLAERELRPFVIMRKTSHDFKSEEVMDSFTLYLSLLQTCKKNGVNFGEALHSVLSGKISPVLKALGL